MTNLKLSILSTLSQWFPEKVEAKREDDPVDDLVATAQIERQRLRRAFTLLLNQSLSPNVLHDSKTCRDLVRDIRIQVLFPLADLERTYCMKDRLGREQLETEARALVTGLRYRSWQIFMMGEAIREEERREYVRSWKEEAKINKAAQKKLLEDFKKKRKRPKVRRNNASFLLRHQGLKLRGRTFSEMSIIQEQDQQAISRFHLFFGLTSSGYTRVSPSQNFRGFETK